MTLVPYMPLTREASRLANRLMPRIRRRISEANVIPVSVLIWGPGIGSVSPLAATRLNLRSDLRKAGHAAFFSEELCDPSSGNSVRLQQLAQAQEFELVVSIPCTPGSIGEIHDFATDRRVRAKTLVFINEEHVKGYSAQSLEAISTILSCAVRRYPSENDCALISTFTLTEVQRIRELKYITEGRV